MSHIILFITVLVIGSAGMLAAENQSRSLVLGLTGTVENLSVLVPAAQEIQLLADNSPQNDINLKRMAGWALSYLINTPRKNLGYEPVFQCHPLNYPPIPEGSDPVVACDTDARMDWEWYYMRDITGSTDGKEVEAAFHKRILSYIGQDGKVWSHPGCYNEGDIHAKYEKKDLVIHVWGATKILKSLSEDFIRTRNPKSKAMARKVMLALKDLCKYDDKGRCYFPAGMGALRADLTPIPNGWNPHPAPVVEPLVVYYLATGDKDGLEFAKAYSEGMMNNIQPDGIKFYPDGSASGGWRWGPHGHATMHAVWGVAHLGVITGEKKYVDFAKGYWDWFLTRGTGTGWFPAGPDSCNETCCISDCISVAILIGDAGHPEYYDYAERYLRNYISNLQFMVTPEFEAYYTSLHTDVSKADLQKAIDELRKFQGGVIGGSGLNDYENKLLGGGSGFEMFGCCAPEGMRAIYTTWSSVIEKRSDGVYVNIGMSRDSKWGKVVSFMPDQGRLTVKAAVKDVFFVRPPHWVDKDQLHAFVGILSVPVEWSGAYVKFSANPGDELTVTYPLVRFTQHVEGLWKDCKPELKMTFEWLGNMVVDSSPAGGKTLLFSGKPRILPPYPGE